MITDIFLWAGQVLKSRLIQIFREMKSEKDILRKIRAIWWHWLLLLFIQNRDFSSAHIKPFRINRVIIHSDKVLKFIMSVSDFRWFEQIILHRKLYILRNPHRLSGNVMEDSADKSKIRKYMNVRNSILLKRLRCHLLRSGCLVRILEHQYQFEGSLPTSDND